MQAELCIGVAACRDGFDIAALAPDGRAMSSHFPAGVLGLAGLRLFLAAYGNSARLAVAGIGAPGLALALENASGAETFIVSPPPSAASAEALARYARRAH
ncbi:hypothetical protein [Rhodocyclus tenuis]|uniref:Uncharacterized protein n=1 Tax=Rhodocyclus tenuis TaxID=1066 RepID=A0A840GH45_RHOTE|nr:hypothetical protein [Rhodocyclus tenuis]MBB4247499.1 hypothetical protein [Rhodocyclus tenuis]MBK1679581.1 hypothetical protein [Rhodocyclus tenuis]